MNQVGNKILKEIKKWGYQTTQSEMAGGLKMWTPEVAQQFKDEFDNNLEQILHNKYFLGLNESKEGSMIAQENCLYPSHKDDILAIYEEKKKRDVSLVILIEGIGSGKSTVNSILTYLEWFRLTCQFNPQKYYGMMDDEIVAFIAMSRSEAQAKRVTLQKIYPKFQTAFNIEYFPADKRRGQEIWIPRNNTLIFAGTSNAASALGYNIFGGVVDEANFLESVEGGKRSRSMSEVYDAAEEMHNAMFNRMNSRFINPYTGKLDGMLTMISSCRYPDDFLEKKAREHFKLGQNSHIFIRRKSLWEAKPKWYFSGIKAHFNLKTKLVEETPQQIDDLKIQGKQVMEDRYKKVI
jgi:hypothetical protein